MKIRNVFLVLSAAFLLTSCNFLDQIKDLAGEDGESNNQSGEKTEAKLPDLVSLGNKYNGFAISYTLGDKTVNFGAKEGVYWDHEYYTEDSSSIVNSVISFKIGNEYDNYISTDGTSYLKINTNTNSPAIETANYHYLTYMQTGEMLDDITPTKYTLKGVSCNKYVLSAGYCTVYVSDEYGVTMQVEFSTSESSRLSFVSIAVGNAVTVPEYSKNLVN